MKISLAYALMIGAMFFAAWQAANAAITPASENFVAAAAVANQFEISSSQIALKDSHNKKIKQFAQHMIDDHKQIGDRMAAALDAPDVQMPAPSGNLDPRHQAMLDTLNQTSAGDFDKKYIDMQVKGHKETASLLSGYARNGDNDTLKSFAAQTLPTVQQHLQYAEKVKSAF